MKKVVCGVLSAIMALVVLSFLVHQDLQRLRYGNINTRVLAVQTFPAPEMNVGSEPTSVEVNNSLVKFEIPGDMIERVTIKAFGIDVTDQVRTMMFGKSAAKGQLYRLKLCGNWITT